MKNVPSAQPRTTAIAIQTEVAAHRDTDDARGATVARCASPENHTGHRCHTLPWRSASGT